MSQTWTTEEIKDLIQFAQALRKENEDLRAMVIASDAVINNKDRQLKQLKELLWKSYN
jgi:sulfur relay (sulfurtransferase) complex TusBCD TusD component (DsrE family)